LQAGCHSQCSGSVARAWAERSVAMTSIPVVARLSGGTISARSAVPLALTPRPRVRVACQRPPLSRIQVTGQKYSSAGEWLTWFIGPLAFMCTTVRPRQLCRPRIASVIPPRSGSPVAAAAPPSATGPARGGRVPACAARFGQVTAGGDAVAGQVQMGAQRGELPGHRAERGQRADRLQSAFPAFSFIISRNWRGFRFEAWRTTAADGLYAVITDDPNELWHELEMAQRRPEHTALSTDTPSLRSRVPTFLAGGSGVSKSASASATLPAAASRRQPADRRGRRAHPATRDAGAATA
jgi:hypothetical protein